MRKRRQQGPRAPGADAPSDSDSALEDSSSGEDESETEDEAAPAPAINKGQKQECNGGFIKIHFPTKPWYFNLNVTWD